MGAATPPKTEAPAPDTRKVFQVKFASGQGQQVPAASADEVRAMMVKHYGADYEIESIEEVKP